MVGPPTAPSSIEVVLVVASLRGRERLISGLQHHYAQFLDDNVCPPSQAPTILAVTDGTGHAEIFANGSFHFDPADLGQAMREGFQNASFHQGSLLVLGRDPLTRTIEPIGAYPQLLATLRDEADPEMIIVQSQAGLVGLADDPGSAVPGVLWWTFASALDERAGTTAVGALIRSARAFGAVSAAPWARRARLMAREINESLQLDLFDPVQPRRVSPLRYEVLPLSFARSTARLDEAAAEGTGSANVRWRQRGHYDGPIGVASANFSRSSLAVRSMSCRPNRADVDLAICVDFLPRIGLNLEPSASQTLRYNCSSADVEVRPSSQTVAAGEQVHFAIHDYDEHGSGTVALTVAGEYGQVFRLRVALASALRGSDVARRYRRAA